MLPRRKHICPRSQKARMFWMPQRGIIGYFYLLLYVVIYQHIYKHCSINKLYCYMKHSFNTTDGIKQWLLQNKAIRMFTWIHRLINVHIHIKWDLINDWLFVTHHFVFPKKQEQEKKGKICCHGYLTMHR